MTLDEARERIGQLVVYYPPGRCECGDGEEGVITSVNDSYVFVRYGLTGSAATRPEDLTAVAP